ncbi:Na(+)/H(+) antiporter NhaP [Planctomycetes bacterium Pan216]|uniref:Na(+)/H(+) antiporter NhaP n=1 Tax=Kolteria novifilia TaxID=2527975 RepID=A0A518B379_9BACT|nr:Na(+)/H(+) antiporter NhaP [Planctomycetes bacterium Pan216]
MEWFNVLGIVVTVTAFASYVNQRFLKLPSSIGVMVFALALSLVHILWHQYGMMTEGTPFVDIDVADKVLGTIDFQTLVLNFMLGLLLFAGAVAIDVDELASEKWPVAAMAVIGTLVSTFGVGYLTWWLFSSTGADVDLIYCLLFGALISPTDPIAVLGIMRNACVPKKIELRVAGESLFNDGISVATFLILLGMAGGTSELTASSVVGIVGREMVGGVLFGLLIGSIATRMLDRSEEDELKILITLALVMGGYALASVLEVSAPLAIVIAGLLVGRRRAFNHVDEHGRLSPTATFWKLIDHVLNMLLFVLLGLEMIAIKFLFSDLLQGIAVIPVVLVARFLGILVSRMFHGVRRAFRLRTVFFMTWAGLRGGVSVALALSLPDWLHRDRVISVTYCVVVFSIVFQGLTISDFARWLRRCEAREDPSIVGHEADAEAGERA